MWANSAQSNVGRGGKSDVSMKKAVYRFTVEDYVAFGFMLLLSALTGVYIAVRNKRKRNEPNRLKVYLTGNRNLKPFPVAMSLIASYISGITILGTPAEIYNYGTQYWIIIFSMTLSGLVVAFVYVPVFTKLQVCSSYEYLELRFSKLLRTIASLFFLMDEMLFMPLLIYVPSLALNQVSGLNVQIIGTIVCVVCVFYVYLGGLKAVVYTDTFQTIIMFISVIVVVAVGIFAIGGFNEIFDRSYDGGRMKAFNVNPSMYERYTFFSVIIGGFTYWTSFNSVNQTMVQRYLSLPSMKKAKISVGIFTVGVVFFISLCCFSGILVYSTYADCDPVQSGRITKYDQILPLFVLETAGHLRGIPGLFIAGVFGAALSSLSVVLNSTAIVLLEDLFRGLCHVSMTERVATIISKAIIICLGVYAIALMYVVQYMGSVLEVATSFSAIAAGTMFGVFSLGMLIPWANTAGAVAGAIAGSLMSGLIAFGTQISVSYDMLASQALPVSVEKCEEIYGIVNATIVDLPQPDESKVFFLFRLSYLWITPIGFSTVMLVGIVVSLLSGKTDTRYLDPELISPVSQWLLPKEAQNYLGTAVKKVLHQRLLGSNQGLLTSSTHVDLNDMTDTETRVGS